MMMIIPLLLLMTSIASSFTFKTYPSSIRKPIIYAKGICFSYQSTPDDPNSEEKTNADNHANQMNPNNDAYWSSRGFDDNDDYYYYDDDGVGSGSEYSQADLDNHANQLNPNNDAYWSSRGG